MRGKLIVVSGPSGSGKSTATKRVRDELKIPLSVSATTRLPREGEVDGKDYYFMTKEEFENLTTKGAVFGWKTKNHMKGFFRNTEKACVLASQMKMKISTYSVESLIEFPDGQVLFFKPDKPKERLSLKSFLTKGN